MIEINQTLLQELNWIKKSSPDCFTIDREFTLTAVFARYLMKDLAESIKEFKVEHVSKGTGHATVFGIIHKPKDTNKDPLFEAYIKVMPRHKTPSLSRYPKTVQVEITVISGVMDEVVTKSIVFIQTYLNIHRQTVPAAGPHRSSSINGLDMETLKYKRSWTSEWRLEHFDFNNS